MTKARLITLLLASGGSGLGGYVLATTTASSTISFRTSTAAVHAVDLREEPGVPPSMDAYASVMDSANRLHYLGRASCVLNDAGVASVSAQLRASWAVECASQGLDGGKVVGVHALDLRRRADTLPDGGAQIVYTSQAYGYTQRADGGLRYLPGRQCAQTPSSGALFDGPALKCAVAVHLTP